MSEQREIDPLFAKAMQDVSSMSVRRFVLGWYEAVLFPRGAVIQKQSVPRHARRVGGLHDKLFASRVGVIEEEQNIFERECSCLR